MLIFARHLERTDARYHEWGEPGVTVCGRHWFVAGYGMRIRPDEQAVEWVHRKNAEKFAQPCKRCAT